VTVQVLHSRIEIDQARRQLRRHGLSHTSPQPLLWLRRIGKKLGLPTAVNVGDTIKSWDVLTTSRFIQQNVSPATPILDIGAYASEILCVLHRLHYAALTGVDLNPALKWMPYAGAIRYEVADFMRTPFPAGAFGAITAISVIEHGFQSQPLLREVTRLLRPGGYFIASFDYWPEKVDTTGIEIFGMDWRIFSKAEVLAFLDEAQTYSLKPYGTLDFEAGDTTMLWSGRRYTFAWLALQKQP
jgi:SAM-dependent methyltransferase